ncbi:3-hydroxyacyl-CoA dehydrogenase NAD-binding domain-containing protein [Bacillus sp. Cr_A10]|uniref:3-hydroxyacyl-CoA dehydrogenase NAD-binding domain-containing protein n=1 Tax=Bacillus sp. Cr_A10 TaxID=3033993 RepID=UPI0023DAF1D2|nr:3-hydroxyacyl-CoA dehydrogenase NAD-binding domain-containing protein [Bacillus sp. Cr_A10]MDF2067350.1 3-hydroxyacyl-CoA dehydrogenase NAD-binding domain-containing protein [Bacillus sp. Cr_A10]
MQHVCVIGGGFMGAALTKYFLKAQVKVSLLEEFASRRMELMADKTFQEVQFLETIEECNEVDFIIEAITENLQAKQQLFERIDDYFPTSTTFCTNTSSYLISSIAKNVKHKNRVIGTHFFSPAHITPLVEVVPSAFTESHHIQKTMNFLQSINKKPVLLKKEIQGFVANRLQSALSREAMSLVQNGIVSSEELDFIAKWSLGIRLANTGPLEQRDINGLDTHMAIVKYVYPTLENGTEPLPVHEDLIANRKLGMKTNEGFYDWSTINKKQYLAHKEDVLLNIIRAVSAQDGEVDN